MQATFKLSLSCFLCLSLALLSGCGGDGAVPTLTPAAQAQGIAGAAPAGVGTTVVSLDPALVGRWGRPVPGTDPWQQGMDLLRDGTGIREYNIDPPRGQRAAGLGVGITWKTDNGRFYVLQNNAIHGNLDARVWNYRVSGTTLTLTDDAGVITTYTRR